MPQMHKGKLSGQNKQHIKGSLIKQINIQSNLEKHLNFHISWLQMILTASNA